MTIRLSDLQRLAAEDPTPRDTIGAGFVQLGLHRQLGDQLLAPIRSLAEAFDQRNRETLAEMAKNITASGLGLNSDYWKDALTNIPGLLSSWPQETPTRDDFEVTENDSGFFEVRRRRGRPVGTRKKWLDREPLIDKYIVCRRAIGRHPTEAEFAGRLGWSRAQLYIVLDSADLSYADLIRHFQQRQGATLLPDSGREQRGPSQGEPERRRI